MWNTLFSNIKIKPIYQSPSCASTKGCLKCGIILHNRLPSILFHTAKCFSANADVEFWVKPLVKSLLTQNYTNSHQGSLPLSLPHLAYFPPVSYEDSKLNFYSCRELQTLKCKSNAKVIKMGPRPDRICLPADLGSLTVQLGNKSPNAVCFHPSSAKERHSSNHCT